MKSSDLERIRSIKTFPSLVKYLRDELDWPIDSDNVDDVMFDYEPEELGLDAKTAVNIKEIKQLRPLTTKQPWGIFFINFEPKHLPVVVLRRVLRALVIKKRQSANRSHQAAWNLHDLLFISSYGESAGRSISFAHFTESEETGDLPSLRVLGWDDQDTVLHLDHAHTTLKEKLRWPNEEENLDTWRTTWSSAFTVGYRQVITNSKELAARMAGLATQIRKRANAVLAIESERGPFRTLHEAFKESLVHDLSEDDFADMYAQTITYGLLTAKFSRPAGLVADNLVDMIPPTNPFLKDLLATFLSIGGRKGKIDFDELGINEVVELLRNTDTEAIKRDFGNLNPDEDPVIRFYEDFLKQYDAKKRMQRGVFFTPVPVVSFIVRSVHEILQTEFGLKDGLADTTTWGEMAERFSSGHSDPARRAGEESHSRKERDSSVAALPQNDSVKKFKIPDGVSPDEPFVLILDIAAGTGTFMVMVIEVIYKTMTAKWKKQGKMELEIPGLWDEYVPKHLLPRLYGFELMMAPYAIAHMKIGLKLSETGYKFRSDERLHLYLTNTLEPPHDFSGQLEFMSPALAHEAQAVNQVKRSKRFTVVIGNPPYAYMSANLSKNSRSLIEPYRYVNGEKIVERGAIVLERALQDDYVKFFAYSQELIGKSGVGLISMISNSAYLRNPNMRGMRNSFASSFNYFLATDLHGDVKRLWENDQNVFDIRTGVAIALLARTAGSSEFRCATSSLIGTRQAKEVALTSSTLVKDCTELFSPQPPQFLFDRVANEDSEYKDWISVSDIFPVTSVGIKTNRDELVIDFQDKAIDQRLRILIDAKRSTTEVKEVLRIDDNAQWSVAEGRKKCRESYSRSNFADLGYRPFDDRRIYYHPSVVFNPRPAVMNHLVEKDNIAFVTNRRIRTDNHAHFFVANKICMAELLSSADNCNVYPLWLKSETLIAEYNRTPNLSSSFLASISATMHLAQKGPLGLPEGLTVEDIFNYMYTVFHSPNYRSNYAQFLNNDFPRVPLTSSIDMFRALAKLGGDLVALHLMESPKLEKHITKFVGKELEVEKVTYSNNTVWIDKAQTSGFKGVPENVWEFHIGGYQVCEKWLKDRKGRTLSKEDIEHYHRIVVALNETIRLMSEIDKVIDGHGGWPIK